MTAIVIKQFSGIAPKLRYLQDQQAQTATNCPAWLGSLSGLPAPSATVLALAANIKTIYRFGQDVDSETQYWFRFTGDVDVVRSQIAGDTAERTFYTDGFLPKATDNILALTGGTDYPMASYRLGIPAPTTATSGIVEGTGTGTPGSSQGSAGTTAYKAGILGGTGGSALVSGASSSAAKGGDGLVTIERIG